MQHLLDEPLPATVYDAAEAALIVYARKSTRLEPIDDATYAALTRHFSNEQIIDICLTVGLSNMVNRFHATFRTDVDTETLAAVAAGDQAAGTCPLPRPKTPGT
ncbi:MAG: carboxymuconolactone decarboxylase family protein [Hyphomicrobiaceae bacterium]